ncbi:flagellar hook-basal body complex protein FliE [Pseudocolwellia sp. AS88]|uniref:flagellar hook-basal body complex protein FliE n=1 Tax=Pseudocolwellia TaxID=2848177 RepID=UPI0026F0F2DC|nr:flagellar hook-basal body complex protein FliE [Pseudocolwellia sp. AS88]MDO7085066.1 flagellar hook-basal body complex protein FliE [Pseudocolwellia sp. AS88]
MDIKSNSLFAQMQSMSLEAMNHNTQAITSDNAIPAVNKSGSNFGDLLKDAVNSVNDLQQTAGAERTAFEMGDPNVTLAQTMISASKASIGFEATVQVRNKFVEAYKEIMNMPV